MSLATPSCVQKLQTASHASLLNSEGVSLFREPDAGNLPVRFDEREQETEPSQTGLRWRGESQANYPPGDYSYCACSRLYSPLHSSALKKANKRRTLVKSPDFVNYENIIRARGSA